MLHTTIYARIKIMLTAFVEEAVARAPSHEWAAELKCKNIQKCKSSFYYEMCAHAIRARSFAPPSVYERILHMKRAENARV
jgi:hypothetical protein